MATETKKPAATKEVENKAAEKAPKAPKQEKPEVVTGTIAADGKVNVNKKDIFKVKAAKAKDYGMEKWYHVAKLGNRGLIFVWDTREIVGITDLDAIAPSDINKNLRDSGEALVITENTPAEVKDILTTAKA